MNHNFLSRIFAVLNITLFFSLNSMAYLTDTGVYAPPASGAYGYNSFMPGTAGFPAVGGTYVDPVFGSTIRRLTNVQGSVNGDDIYAKHQANANGTMAFFRNSSGVRIINPHTGAVLVSAAQPTGVASFEMHWDALDPDKYYYFEGANLMRRSISAQTSTIVKTFPGTLEKNGGSLNIQSRDGRYITVRYGGTNKVYDVQSNTIYAGAVNPLDEDGWAAITPDGNYMVTAAGPGLTHYSYAIDHATKSISTSFKNFWTLCGDHGALVSASNGKSYMVTSNCYNNPITYRVDITVDQTGKSPEQQEAANKALVRMTWEDSGHFSCVSKGANQDWCFYSSESVLDNYNTSTSGWTAFKSEIYAMNVITGEVRRYAHHRSRSMAANYANQPRVSTSWDGSVVMWVSNFNNSSPVGYADMYSISNPLGTVAPPPVNVAPVASITSPATGASFVAGSNITINANASDSNGSVVKVEFYNGSVKLGEDATSPYSFVVSAALVGSYSFTARAVDNLGAVGLSSAVAVTVVAPPPVNVAPVASITSPATGASFVAGSSITINANASDSNGSVAKVEFYNGSVKMGEDATSPYSFVVSAATVGSYSFTARAVDNLGAVGLSSAVAVTVVAAPPVDSQNPTVSFSAPAAGAVVSGTVQITAAASDNVGVVGVQFKVDGVNFGSEDTSAPYSVAMNSSTYANGAHTIVAVARDAAGRTAQASLSISVQNVVAPAYSMTVPASVVAGSTVTVNFKAPVNHSATDWISVYLKGAPDTSYGEYKYTGSATSGSMTLRVPSAPGVYEARYFINDTWTRVAVSPSFTVVAPADTTVPSAAAITSPVAGASVRYSSTVTIRTSVADNVGVTRVEFYVNNVLVGTDTTASDGFTYAYRPGSTGTKTLRIRAYDAAGNSRQSNSVTIQSVQ